MTQSEKDELWKLFQSWGEHAECLANISSGALSYAEREKLKGIDVGLKMARTKIWEMPVTENIENIKVKI